MNAPTEIRPHSAQALLNDLAAYRSSRSNLPQSPFEAETKLLSRGLDAADIRSRRDAFTTYGNVDKTAVLSNYELLHGTPYLDATAAHRMGSAHADAIVALWRAAEICWLNLDVLAQRSIADLDAHEFGQAAVKMQWINHFQTTLYDLSQRLVLLDQGSQDGAALSCQQSSAQLAQSVSMSRLHSYLRERCPENLDDFSTKDLDDPGRFLFFHAFVNETYTNIWRAGFDAVRVPGLVTDEGESAAALYERVVQPSVIADAVHSVDLKEVTYLMQFRAYHQISEVLVKLVNEWLCHAIEALLQPESAPSVDLVDTLRLCNELLALVVGNIRPIVRTLSPKAYFEIRPALGTTSGSHSHNLRRGLFQTVYPLLAKSLRLRLSGFDERQSADDEGVYQQARAVLTTRPQQLEAEVVHQSVRIFQHVRTWRDEHMQFVKTQIGVSHSDATPTASISGAENAAQTADRFRSVHAKDPMAPIYKAVTGRPPAPPFALLAEGSFDAYMANRTAEAVQFMYADVQARAHRRQRPAMGY